ncbi:MAG: hypothetical protein WCY22_00610 [Acholeplasmataceae bacterium]
MKYFKAILFTLLMSLIFFGAIIFSEGVYAARKMAEIITAATNEENYHILLRANFQSKEPIIDETVTNSDFTLKILGYETAAVVDGELKSFLEFIIITTEGEMGYVTDMEATLKTSDEEISIWFLKYFNLEVYSVMTDPATYNVLEISDIFKEDTTILEMLVLKYTPENATEKAEMIMDIQKQKSDFVFESTLLDYYMDNDNRYPTIETEEIKLYQAVRINTFSTLMISGGITLVLIALFTYYIYSVRPRRKLGKAKPSINLRKDIAKLNQSDNNQKENE